MCASRKRYRPLDAAEERSVHVRQTVQLALLEDERTYCYSWPSAALTTRLTQRAYVQGDGSASPHAGEGAHARADVTRTVERLLGKSSSSDGGGSASGATALAAAATPQRVTLPPVYTLSCRDGDVRRLLASCRRHGGACIRMRSAPARDAHAAAAHATTHAPCTRCSDEDSALSLTQAQWRDVRRCGVLARVQQAQQLARATDDASRRDARVAIEREVVSLEWQAYNEAQHTAAALQRLLTLDAAVPYTPSTTTLTPTLPAQPAAPTHGDDGDGVASTAVRARRAAQEATSAWRRDVYALWLRWRMHMPLLHADDAVPVHALALMCTTTAPCTGGDVAFVVQRGAHPWGAPLLAGAFLYGTQNDYFLNPQLAPGTPAQQAHAVGSALQHRDRDEGDNTTATTASTTSRARLRGKAARAHATADDADRATCRRRGGPYGFLRWHLERCLRAPPSTTTTTTSATARPRAMGGGGKRSSNSSKHGGSSMLTLSTSDMASGDAMTSTLLSSSAIEALVLPRVLQQPLSALLDDDDEAAADAESGAKVVDRCDAALRALACDDLRRETQAWRTWLAKT